MKYRILADAMLRAILSPCPAVSICQDSICCKCVPWSTHLQAVYKNKSVNSERFRLFARKSNDEQRLQDIDFSVFRFTLGIPGFDDSELPRILGLLFGSLIILNHIFSSGITTVAQLRSEIAGLFLSAVAISLPYIRKYELDTTSTRAGNLPVNIKQVFAMVEWLNDMQKEELAWGSYALVRNTKTIAVLVWSGEEIVLARGCWDVSKATTIESLAYLQDIFIASPFFGLTSTMYLSSGADRQGLKLIPKGVKTLLAEPFTEKKGGILVVSDIPRAYNVKDRTWIQLIANKMAAIL